MCSTRPSVVISITDLNYLRVNATVTASSESKRKLQLLMGSGPRLTDDANVGSVKKEVIRLMKMASVEE